MDASWRADCFQIYVAFLAATARRTGTSRANVVNWFSFGGTDFGMGSSPASHRLISARENLWRKLGHTFKTRASRSWGHARSGRRFPRQRWRIILAPFATL